MTEEWRDRMRWLQIPEDMWEAYWCKKQRSKLLRRNQSRRARAKHKVAKEAVRAEQETVR